MPIKVKTFKARKANTLMTILEGIFAEMNYDDIHEISVKKTDDVDWPFDGTVHYKVKDD